MTKTVTGPETIPAMFFERVARFGPRPALLHKKDDRYRHISWTAFGEAVREVACGLIYLGVQPGDRVAIMAYNRPEWAVADLAILAAGAVSVPIYHTSTPAQSDFIFEKTGARNSFVARSEKAEMLASCSSPVDRIISLDPVGVDSPGGCALDYEALRVLGREGFREGMGEELEKRMAAIKPDDCATIIFTSGTTGEPKGVMLSHANILTNVAGGLAAQDVGPDDLCLSFLPLSHAFERTVGQFLMLAAGATIAYAVSIRTVAENMREVRPTIMLGVPRFFEKLHSRVLDAVDNAPAPRRILFHWAMKAGRLHRRMTAAGKQPGAGLRLKLGIAERLVFARFQGRLGGRLRFFISGGAPLSADIIEFFLDAGVHILEGYGLTEYSPVIAVNPFGWARPGTVGKPLVGVEVKIAEDGEIAVRGPSVMLGYYSDQEATGRVVRDGWLYTGDLGALEDGYLRITDRKKDIIVTSGGKNVSPQQVENLIASDELISQVVVYGDRKKYLTALVVPDYERLAQNAPAPGLKDLSPAELAENPEFYELLMARVAEKCADLAPYESVKKIVVLAEPFTLEKGELTPTMKVKRKAVVNKLRDRLDSLYLEDEKEGRVRSRWP